MNQGMLMESLNLAAIWKLPILFICKDNDMAITTKSTKVTSGSLISRASSFGIPAEKIDGTDVEIVWKHANTALKHIRLGYGPYFLHAHCIHLEGHFLGDPILRQIRQPVKETKNRAVPLIKSLTKKGGVSAKLRAKNLGEISSLFGTTLKNELSTEKDPINIMRKRLSNTEKLKKLESTVKAEIKTIIEKSLNQI
jgi:pyruvate dehydrogenase E1 component alpha subunit